MVRYLRPLFERAIRRFLSCKPPKRLKHDDLTTASCRFNFTLKRRIFQATPTDPTEAYQVPTPKTKNPARCERWETIYLVRKSRKDKPISNFVSVPAARGRRRLFGPFR